MNSALLMMMASSSAPAASAPPKSKPETTTESQHSLSAPDVGQFVRKAHSNRDSILLLGASLAEQVQDYIPKVRGSNSISCETRQEALSFLESILTLMEQLPDILPNADQIDAEAECKLSNWCSKFFATIGKVMQRYADPDQLAEAVAPIPIVLGSAAMGSMFGGNGVFIGAAAGSLFTHQVNQAKATEKILGVLLKGDADQKANLPQEGAENSVTET